MAVQTDDSTCPSCLNINEHAEHLYQCPDPARSQLLADDTVELVQWMSIRENTHPEITDWVEKYISSCGKPISCSIAPFPSISDLIESQNEIGWRNFIQGRISRHFHCIQYCHLIWEMLSPSFFALHALNGFFITFCCMTRPTVSCVSRSKWQFSST